MNSIQKDQSQHLKLNQKKVEVKKEVVVKSEGGDEIKETFEFFDANGDGRKNAREIRGAMQSIGYAVNKIIRRYGFDILKKIRIINFVDFYGDKMEIPEVTEDLSKEKTNLIIIKGIALLPMKYFIIITKLITIQ